jgi:mannose-6-phosphate isomerase-like protein (cupin superfamily)
MNFLQINTTSAQETFKQIEDYMASLDFKIINKDLNRPWGGFLVIDEGQAQKFASTFFNELDFNAIQTGKLSPKILIVAPHKRLSWQYHHRRSELWKLIGGQAAVVTSPSDEEGAQQSLALGQLIQLKQGERHRLVGTSGWGVLAEIWQHVDPQHPSDESDIVRVQDDFGR